jgi:hypothetical protein
MQKSLSTSHLPAIATVAAFFRSGIKARICTLDEVRAWALSVIAESDHPPGEIIEVSWSKPLDAVLADLAGIEGEVDETLVGHWLIGRVAELPATSADEIWDRLRQAMQIARDAGLSDLYDEFNALDDRFNLAFGGTYGEVGGCCDEFLCMLATFPKTPFNFK